MEPDREDGSIYRMVMDLEARLDRTIEQQRQAQRDLFADFLRQVSHAKNARGPHAENGVYNANSLSGMPPKAPKAPALGCQTSPVLRVVGDQVQENSVKDDIEWLGHAIMQPSFRGKRAKLKQQQEEVEANRTKQSEDVKEETEIEGEEQDLVEEEAVWMMDESTTPVARKVVRWIAWFKTLEEPPRSGFLNRAVKDRRFTLVCTVVIVANAIYIAYSTDENFSAAANGRPIASGTRQNMLVIEMLFLVFYSVELILKLAIHKLFFFINDEAGWNMLDFFLVFTSLIDAVSIGGQGISFLRVLRIFKVTKVIRTFRALKFVAALRLMVDCLLGTIIQFFWAVVLILFIVALFSICFVQGATAYLDDNRSRIEESEVTDLNQFFGSVAKAMHSLMEAATGGRDWSEIYDLLVPVGSIYSYAFIFYVMFMMVSVFNLVTSLFVDRALKIARPSEAMILAEKERECLQDERWLMKLCEDLNVDQNGDGVIEYEDVKRCMTDIDVREHFDARGIMFEDTHTFYQMLVMGKQFKPVDLRSFVTACIRLKGHATSMDLHTLAFELKLMRGRASHFDQYCQEKFSSLEKQLSMANISSSGIDPGAREEASSRTVARAEVEPGSSAAAAAATAAATRAKVPDFLRDLSPRRPAESVRNPIGEECDAISDGWETPRSERTQMNLMREPGGWPSSPVPVPGGSATSRGREQRAPEQQPMLPMSPVAVQGGHLVPLAPMVSSSGCSTPVSRTSMTSGVSGVSRNKIPRVALAAAAAAAARAKDRAWPTSTAAGSAGDRAAWSSASARREQNGLFDASI